MNKETVTDRLINRDGPVDTDALQTDRESQIDRQSNKSQIRGTDDDMKVDVT